MKTLLPSAHPNLIPSLALQGRLLQTKKSGYFPSSSVKPCPVDARVSAEGEMERGDGRWGLSREVMLLRQCLLLCSAHYLRPWSFQ